MFGISKHGSRTRAIGLWCVVTVAIQIGCRALDPDYAYRTRPYSVTRLTLDSPGVRRLLAAAGAREKEENEYWRGQNQEAQLQQIEDMELHPERYMVERSKLLNAMAQQPGFEVTGEQYFREIDQSDAGCAKEPASSSNYVLVRVTTGPLKGREGWACDADVKRRGP